MLLNTAVLLLSICLALTRAEMPWMARIEDFLQPRARVMVESTCHSFSTNEIQGLGGETPLLHLCDFPQYDNVLCAFTTLQKCCPSMAVTQQLAQPVRFEEIVFAGTTYTVQFYNTLNGVCYISEPEVPQVCFECVEPLPCVNVGALYCEDGVNFTIPCVEGLCICREGHIGEDCCQCDTDNDFYRNLDSALCETCGCCTENVVGGSDACDDRGKCGACVEGFNGDKCCDDVTTTVPTGSSESTVSTVSTGSTDELTTGGCGIPCIIGIVVGIILAILLFLLLLLLIYGLYRYKTNPNTKLEETGAGIGGDARDNPLYLEPAAVVDEAQ